MITAFQEYLFEPADKSNARSHDLHLFAWTHPLLETDTPSHDLKRVGFLATLKPHLSRVALGDNQGGRQLALIVTGCLDMSTSLHNASDSGRGMKFAGRIGARPERVWDECAIGAPPTESNEGPSAFEVVL